MWRRRNDFMNKIVAKAGMAVGIFLGVAIVAYAITNLFFQRALPLLSLRKKYSNLISTLV